MMAGTKVEAPEDFDWGLCAAYSGGMVRDSKDDDKDGDSMSISDIMGDGSKTLTAAAATLALLAASF